MAEPPEVTTGGPLADAEPKEGGEPADYVALEDGALVSGRALLSGERRGQPYLPVPEAAARRWEALLAADATDEAQAEKLAAAEKEGSLPAAGDVGGRGGARVLDRIELALKLDSRAPSRSRRAAARRRAALAVRRCLLMQGGGG